MNDYMILAINPGSTSTKIAVFNGDDEVWNRNIAHAAAETAGSFDGEVQKRKKQILDELSALNGFSPAKTDAFVGRGGGLKPCLSGTYEINGKMVADCRAETLIHPSVFAPAIAWEFAKETGRKAYTVNPPSSDEYKAESRVTGLKGCVRQVHGHPLNQKEVAYRAAAEAGKKYGEMNFIVAHLGGGITVTAHQKGRMIDSTDAISGEGPMSPTRCGAVPVLSVIDLCFSGKFTRSELETRVMTRSGLSDYLGVSDNREIARMREAGDKTAILVYNAMIYQIAKHIGAMAAALEGRVDAILLTGGLAHDRRLTGALARYTGFIAPVKVYPGEFEMEALAHGALRVLRGQEKARVYTGAPVFGGFPWD